MRLPPLSYESHYRHPLATAIRALGVALLALAMLGLAMIPIGLFKASQSATNIPQGANRSFFVAWAIIGTALGLGLVVLQIAAGVALMRLRPRSTSLARAWAVAALACGALSVAVNLYFQFHAYPRALNFTIIAYIVAYFLDHWAMGMTVPIFVLVFSRAAAFGEAMNQQN